MEKGTFDLPPLELSAWEQSKITLNLYLQIVGKVQLALMPRKNHWWNITFLVNSKGLITHTIPADGFTFEIQFNFLAHTLEIVTSKGWFGSFPMRDGLSVAELYKHVFSMLAELNIHPVIIAHPYDLPDANPITTPFEKLTGYASYNPEYVQRFWRIMAWTNEVLTEFSGRFYGKSSPVQLFWHHMDLVHTRFCGRPAPELPASTNVANRDAYSHEQISFGFWAGDDKVRDAAFYSYTYPSPKDIDKQPLQPARARWMDSNGSPLALLMYDDLLATPDRRKTLLDFLESSYMAGAILSEWDIKGNYCGPLK